MFFWIPLGLTGPCCSFLALTGPYWILLGRTGPYWALPGLTWTLPGVFDQFSCYLQVFCEQVDLNPNSARYLMISNAPNNPCQPRGKPWRPSIYFIQFAAYKSPAIVDWTKPPTQLVQTEELLHINLCFFSSQTKKENMAKT